MYKVVLIDAPNVERLVKDVANLYVSSAAGVDAIVTERNAANESNEALPPVITHQLAVLSHSKFCSVARTHQEFLVDTGWSATCINVMEQEHQDLIIPVAAELALHAELSFCKSDVSFDAGRSVVKVPFYYLKKFVGGIASVFLGMAQAESDFSIVKI